MSLAEFLLARIAEDEAQANNVLVFRFNPATDMPGNQAIPARVLAECKAKREVVGLHRPLLAAPDTICNRCTDYMEGSADAFPCDTLRTLATIYSDHPDYRAEWAL